MTWPTSASKANTDEGTDDPKQALLTDLVGLIDKFNEMRSHVTSFMQTFISHSTATAARADLDAQQLIDSLTAETSPATGDLIGLRDVSAGADRKMTLANALKVIDSLTAETSPATGDKLALYDASGAAADSITLADLLKIVNALTADSSPDPAADYVMTYDASAGAAKKVLLEDVSTGITLGTAQTPSAVAEVDFTGLPAGLNRIVILFDELSVDNNTGADLRVLIGDSGGFETSGYWDDNGPSQASYEVEGLPWDASSGTIRGRIAIERLTGNTWIFSSAILNDADSARHNAGSKTLTAELDRVRLFVDNNKLFDAGTVNIQYQ